jgi:NHL repeat
MGSRGRGHVGIAAAFALLTMALLAPGSAAAFGPVSSFGSDGEGAGQLSAPAGIAVAPSGDFYVADEGNDRVDVFSPAGEFLFAFGAGVRPGGGGVCDEGSGCQRGEGGSAAGALDRPTGIAVSGPGRVYVAEGGNDRVSVFSATGEFLFAFGYRVDPTGGNACTADSGCQKGSNLRVPEDLEIFSQEGPEGALGEPSGVAIDASGHVYVAEAGNSRVSVFGPVGNFLYAFGWEVEGKTFAGVCTANCEKGGWNFEFAGGFQEPLGIALLPEDLIAISDAAFHRLDVFTREGVFEEAIGHEVSPAGEDACDEGTGCQAGSGEGPGALESPAGIAVGSDGSLTIADFGLQRVSQLDSSGEFVRAFGLGVIDGAEAFQVCTPLTGCDAGLQGSAPGATSTPFGVVEACSGSIFVAESTFGLSRVERFGEPGSAASCPPRAKAPAPAPGTVVVTTVPTNVFKLGAFQRDRRKGTASLQVSVPGPGGLTLRGNGVYPVERGVSAAATLTLPVHLVGKARRDLLAAGQRKATAKVTFTPGGGTARTETRKLTLVKQAKP